MNYDRSMTDNSTKILQKVLDGQTAIRKDIKTLKNEMNEGFTKVNERVDKLGKSLAYLEDDAPTRDEFGKLEVRIKKVEQKVAII